MGLKILFLSHTFYPDIGGIETNSEILATAFTKAGHEIHLLTWSGDVNDTPFPFQVIRSPGVKKLFAEHKWANVVFENNPCLRMAWPGLFFGRPSIVALNTWITQTDGSIGLQERLKFLWLRRAAKVIAVSDAVRKRCWPKAVVIRNPYRENDFKIIPGIARTKDFVFLGRLVSDKGADHAIRAIHQLQQATEDDAFAETFPELTIIGNGPDREKLEALAGELNVKDHICFAGSLRGNDLVACLNKHRFMLVPSLWEEPFGNVALEGMACGCLPVVSDGGGLPDAVGEAGLTFKRGNLDELVLCLQHVLNNAPLEDKIRAAAVPHLKAHRAAVVSKRYLEVIEKAVKKNK